jgi:hypothetical protein
LSEPKHDHKRVFKNSFGHNSIHYWEDSYDWS